MSKKQIQHSEAYHITSGDDYEKLFDKKCDDDCDEENQIVEEINKDAEMIVSALETIVEEIKDLDPSLIKKSVETYINDEDIEEMKKLYHDCFDKIDNDNDLKIYVLYLFTLLQIPINRDE